MGDPSDKPAFRPGNVTLMVCTYRREDLLPRFIQSVAALKVPRGVKLHLVVSDNNPESHFDAYIGALLKKLRFKSSYGHEPQAGYANARNLAIRLALETPAELFAFADDDMELDPGWLEGHLRSHAEFGTDVIGGAIARKGSRHEHGRRFSHGQICVTQGTGNVSFRRWLIAEEGLRLRFDERFNKTGGEDQAFFAAAREGGAVIVFSAWPVIHDPQSEQDWLEELENKARVSAVMHRNRVVRARKERNILAGLLVALGGLRFGLKGLVGYADYGASRATGHGERAEKKRVSAMKNIDKMRQGFRGLAGDYVARQDVRRGG
ncbi:MAG: glycosyltransferase family 2 protein [Hyphomicrobiales bacterium]